MKVLVTGACGLVGSEIVEYLRTIGISVTAVGRQSKDGDQYICCDLESDDLRQHIPESYDYIIHAAACIPGKQYSDDECYEHNRRIDTNVFELAYTMQAGVIYISSAVLYGLSDPSVKTEESEVCFLSRYHRGKYESEEQLLNLMIPTYIFRIPSPYGYRQVNRNVLKIFIENAVARKDITYYGEGSRTMNFVHVHDIAAAVGQAVTRQQYGIYNIASSKAVSMRELAAIVENTCSEVLGYHTAVIRAGQPDPQENVRFLLSIEKAKKNLDWRPEISLEDGIKDWMIKEYCV